MADPTPAVSPTGAPILPPKYVPIALILGALVIPLAMALQDPTPWSGAKLGKLIAAVVPGVLGILSPGMRSQS